MLMLALLLACSSDPEQDPTTTTGTSGDGGATTADTGTQPAPPAAEVSHWVALADNGASSADVVVAPDGTAFALVQTDAALWLHTSSDGGESFSTAVEVTAGDFTAHGLSHPQLATDGSRVAVAAASGQDMRVWIGDVGSDNFVGHDIGADRDDLMYEGLFVRAHFAPDGELWISAHAFPHDGGWADGWKAVARESQGFTLASATGAAAGEPCECCPQDLAFTPDGRPVLGFRNNIDNIRDMWVAIGDADGTFAEHIEVSDNDWALNYCPVQGPRLTARADRIALTWADAAEGAYAVRIVVADSSGLAFSVPVDVAPDADVVQQSPTLAMDDSGALWVAYEQDGDETMLVTSGDAGSTWGTPAALSSPSGALSIVELSSATSGQGPVLLSGISDDGAAWIGSLPQ